MSSGLRDQLGSGGLSESAEPSEYVFNDPLNHFSADSSAGESSSSATLSNSPGQAIAPRGPIAIAPLNPVARAPAKKKLERRGHFKSRNGCFNCKKRRIKVITQLPGTLSFSPDRGVI